MEKSRRSSDGNRDTGTPYPIIATRLERNWSMWIRHFRNSTEAATYPDNRDSSTPTDANCSFE